MCWAILSSHWFDSLRVTLLVTDAQQTPEQPFLDLEY
jgi:hypothetical protein